MKDTYYIVCHKFIHQKVKHNPTEFIHVFSSPTLAFVILLLLKSVLYLRKLEKNDL